MFTCSNFVIFWVFIEFMMLIFIGLSYTLFINNFSSLILYFLIQTLSSFSILIFYLYPFPILFTMSLFLKLSMFPFHFWFLNVCYRFPNFVLFLVSSLHKFPIFLLILIFSPSMNFYAVSISLVLTMLVSGFIMLSSVDFRAVLVSSSVGNNSWFLLSSLVDLFTFTLFFFVYSLTLYLLFSELRLFSKFTLHSFSKGYFAPLLYVVMLSGLPPFPIFFVKIFVIMSFFLNFSSIAWFLLFIIRASLMLIGYLYSISKYFVNFYSSQSLYLLSS